MHQRRHSREVLHNILDNNSSFTIISTIGTLSLFYGSCNDICNVSVQKINIPGFEIGWTMVCNHKKIVGRHLFCEADPAMLKFCNII